MIDVIDIIVTKNVAINVTGESNPQEDIPIFNGLITPTYSNVQQKLYLHLITDPFSLQLKFIF